MTRFAPLSLLVAVALGLSPIALGALGVVQPVAVAAAEGEVTWSVEPVPTPAGQRRTFEYTTDPGTQIIDSVLITNSGPTAAEFLIYATDAINEYETGAFSLLKRDVEPTDVGAWITPASDKLTIEPGQQATVPFNLLVPSDATPGDHVAGIVAAVLTTSDQDGSVVTIEQRVGARVYLSVSGVPEVGVETVGLVSGFSPSLNPFAPGTVQVSYDIRNTGNLRLDVNQKIQINGPFDIPLGTHTPEPLTELLPRQTVRVTADIPAIGALLLAWSTVTLAPGPIGTAGQAGSESTEPSPAATAAADAIEAPADGTVAEEDLIDFQTVSATTMTLAVSWTLLALVIVAAATGYLVWRYVSGTRELLYQAVDDAVAAAREEESDEPDSSSPNARGETP